MQRCFVILNGLFVALNLWFFYTCGHNCYSLAAAIVGAASFAYCGAFWAIDRR